MANKLDCKKELQLYYLFRKYLCRIAGFVGALIVFSGIVNMLNYVYVEDLETRSRIILHDFYEDKGKIDNVYIGSSHVYEDINVLLLDEINGLYNFNLASSQQKLNGSYYLLREADRKNALNHVYLELYYVCSTKDNFNSDEDPINDAYKINWRNIDYMEISLNKLEYMLAVANPEKYVDVLFPFSRYRSKLGNSEYVKRICEKKQESSYMSYEFYKYYPDENGYDEYLGQGFYNSTKVFLDEKRIVRQLRILEENPMGETSEKYLRKIISYCQRKDISITLFVSPMDKLQLVSTRNYDCYLNQVRGIAEEYEVAFYDFNLIKEQYLPIYVGEYFRDSGHLNNKGADIFTVFFNEVVSRDISENEKYFYSSYAEKLESESPSIYGLYYRDSETAEDGETAISPTDEVRTFWVASNREKGMEYRIIMTPNESEQYMVQDFAENKEFTVSLDEHGICTIVARMKDNPDKVQTLEISY